MNIPKYIEKALTDRVKAADKFIEADDIISRFLEKHNIDNDVDTADFRGGVEALVNPDASADRIRQAIMNKGE